MKKIIAIIIIISIVLIGILLYFENNNNSIQKEGNNSNTNINDNDIRKEDSMLIIVSDGENSITYELNNSTAALDLYNQLPLTVDVDNFSANEKIFYPENKLDIKDTPNATSGNSGALCYYAPWGDVVMFYDSYSSSSGLYELGKAVDNVDKIKDLNGKITIEKQ